MIEGKDCVHQASSHRRHNRVPTEVGSVRGSPPRDRRYTEERRPTRTADQPMQPRFLQREEPPLVEEPLEDIAFQDTVMAAHDEWRALPQERHDLLQSYREFSEKLIARFDRKDVELYYRDLAQLRQSGHIDAYINEFQRIAVMVPEMPERQVVMLFIEGLHDRLRGLVKALKPTTLHEAIRTTLDLDTTPVQPQRKNVKEEKSTTRAAHFFEGHRCLGKGKIHLIKVEDEESEDEHEQPTPGIANEGGLTLPCKKKVNQVSILFGEYTLCDDFYDMDLKDNNVVLGMQWLHSLGRVTQDVEGYGAKFPTQRETSHIESTQSVLLQIIKNSFHSFLSNPTSRTVGVPSCRDILELTEALKAKNEEGEAYIAEIETIGQAYEDMQTQNQRLLQQITERDDYNIKLVSESVKAKQVQNSLLLEKTEMEKQLHQTNASAEMYKSKIVRLEEQARTYLDQLGKMSEEGRQYALTLESTKRNLVDVEKESQSLKSCLESLRKEAEQCRHKISEIQEELIKERRVEIIFWRPFKHYCYVLYGFTISNMQIVWHASGLGRRELKKNC
ncbi:hypothetical protein KI387_042400 [Taxus chinensis]|uniref:E3 ubiquitin protein ligase n=1 Tax=Taxus chinensis TaxID=29808 RepID=A0AA38C140_TAXCH|nr:hypothetical protein KI387_042400 [Taxus chinensis]